MPVYASTPAVAGRRRHPKTLLLIVAAHAVALAAVMSARMEMPISQKDPRLIRIPLPEETPPPEPKPQPRTEKPPVDPPISAPEPRVPTPPIDPPIDAPPLPLPPLGGPANPSIGDPGPSLPAPPRAEPVRVGPRFVTPDSALKPPYPAAKLRLQEEASLRLRLSIDQRGRVVAVEPAGHADPIFLAAARKHILARWRYKPATEDGRPIASSTVVTLRFQLDDF